MHKVIWLCYFLPKQLPPGSLYQTYQHINLRPFGRKRLSPLQQAHGAIDVAHDWYLHCACCRCSLAPLLSPYSNLFGNFEKACTHVDLRSNGVRLRADPADLTLHLQNESKKTPRLWCHIGGRPFPTEPRSWLYSCVTTNPVGLCWQFCILLLEAKRDCTSDGPDLNVILLVITPILWTHF